MCRVTGLIGSLRLLRQAPTQWILDLEDAVVQEHKAFARAAIADRLLSHGDADPPMYVRINGAIPAGASGDLTCMFPAPPAGVILPKVETADQILASITHSATWSMPTALLSAPSN